MAFSFGRIGITSQKLTVFASSQRVIHSEYAKNKLFFEVDPDAAKLFLERQELSSGSGQHTYLPLLRTRR